MELWKVINVCSIIHADVWGKCACHCVTGCSVDSVTPASVCDRVQC